MSTTLLWAALGVGMVSLACGGGGGSSSSGTPTGPSSAMRRAGIVDGDKIMGMWAVQMKKEGILPNDTVVSTVMSNLGLEQFLSRNGIKLLRAKVGDRYVTEKMLAAGHRLGGEQSGHVICLDFTTTGDGPITALHVLHTMKKEGKSLGRLVSNIRMLPHVLVNVPVPRRVDLKAYPDLMKVIKDAEAEIVDRGRILVRPSGSEQKVRC